MRIDDEDRYCSKELLTQLLEAKDFFDTVDRRVLDAVKFIFIFLSFLIHFRLELVQIHTKLLKLGFFKIGIFCN